MSKTKIDAALLDKAPLTEYERNLITLIDIQGVPLKQVAGDLGKDDSTVSLQRKKAVEKYVEWSCKIDEEQKREITSGKEAAVVFALLEKGKELPKIVIELKIDPENVKNYYDRWLELKKADVNQKFVPVIIDRLKTEVDSVKDDLNSLDDKLVPFVSSVGSYKLRNCSHNIDGYCMNWVWNEPPEFITSDYKEKHGKHYMHAEQFCCGLCTAFEGRKDTD